MNQHSKDELKPTKSSAKGINRIARNAASVLAGDVANRATTFALYALVARYLGTYEFGQMALGLTLLRTFQLLAVAGLKTLITREVAKDKTETGRYLVNSSAVVFVSSTLSILALVGFTQVMGYSPDTSMVVILLSLSLIPYSLSIICDAIFQAREKMHYITYANVIVNAVKISVGCLILITGFGLSEVILLLIFSHAAVLLVKWWLLLRYIIKPKLVVDVHFCVGMAKSTVTFLGINGLNAALTSINVVLLSKFVGEVEVGLYSSATQLLIPITLVFQSIVSSVYPVMCRRFESSFHNLKQIAERLIEFLMLIFVPTAVGLFILSDTILLFLYGNKDFAKAAIVLQILVGILILRVFAKVLGLVLVASLKEKITLRILLIDLITTIICSPLLISHYGLIGAAMTTLIVRVVDFVQHYIPVSRMFSNIAVGNLVWKPVVASIFMACCLVILKDQNLLVAIFSSGALYVIVLSTVMYLSIGGPQQIKAKYLNVVLR